MKNIFSASIAVTLLTVACGAPVTPTPTDSGTVVKDGGTTNDFGTGAKITAYLAGKTLVMAGADIPNSPIGYSQNLNLGAASQCYNKVTITTAGAAGQENFTVVSDLGQLNVNNADAGTLADGGTPPKTYTCDNATKTTTVMFTSNTLVVSNVKDAAASCFDILASYTGFAQEGRGSISADGKTVILELYFKDKTIGHSCSDGAVGSSTVKFAAVGGATPVAFTGNAQQTYRVTP